MKKTGKVLICPLDWGIGHATRCIPVIRALQDSGYHIIAAASGRSLQFLKKECPEISVVEFPGTRVNYPENNRLTLRMFRLAPVFLAGIWKEHRTIKKLVSKFNPDLIISDNRYGCWHRGITSVFMTHQLDIQVPRGIRFLKRPLNLINHWFIRKYDECWIPDFEPHKGLAGILSHPVKLPSNARYIGILSRFSAYPELLREMDESVIDLVVMLSGPEPQRTILEKKILGFLDNIKLRVILIQGITEKEESQVVNERIHIFSHLETEKMARVIQRTSMIICRSGYSSIMDIVTLGKRAVFIPTPGQTEQEYLARYLLEKKIFFSMNQNDFDLVYALEMSVNFPGMIIRNDYTLLHERIAELSAGRFSPRHINKEDTGND
ncbi:MAG: glycosyltransferase family protein [Bacteroidota bacterium]